MYFVNDSMTMTSQLSSARASFNAVSNSLMLEHGATYGNFLGKGIPLRSRSMMYVFSGGRLRSDVDLPVPLLPTIPIIALLILLVLLLYVLIVV